MNKEALLKEKKQLEQSREQAVAQINQITGAIAIIEKLIADENKVEEVVEATDIPEKQAA